MQRSRSASLLQQMAIFITVLTGGGCSLMYYLMQKKFAASEYHRLALECLNAHTTAMENLGAPPLKVHNLHLTDRYNSMDQTRAQIKIPVTGSKTGGYLYATSIRDAQINRWHLQEAILQLRDGKQIDIFSIHQHKRD